MTTYDEGPPAMSDDDGTTRQPPSDIVAEQAVLGAMLMSPAAIADVVEVVSAPDFYRPAHETIFDAILDLYAAGDVVDAITVNAALTKAGHTKTGGALYLHDLVTATPTAVGADHYARIVADTAVRRRIIEASTRAIQDAHRGEGHVTDLANRVQADLFAATKNRTSEDYRSLADLLGPTFDKIEVAANHDGSMTGIPTGFRDLDSLTNGLQPGQMVIIAGRPGLGKSVLSTDIARHAAIKHGMTTAIFNLEMGAVEVTTRILAAEASVPLQNLTKGYLDDGQWQRLSRAMGSLTEAPLFIDDSPNMTLPEIRAKARRLKQTNDLKLIVVDYLQLMSSGKRSESRQQEVSEFSRALKLLAKELEVPVIALSQLNRGSEQRTDKKPMLSDLRESGSLEQDSDLVILIHREDVYDRESVRAGEADLIVAKHRNGPTDTIVVAMQGHFSRFVDMAT